MEERPDGMVIEGVGGLKGGSTVSNGDHRIAMAMPLRAWSPAATPS